MSVVWNAAKAKCSFGSAATGSALLLYPAGERHRNLMWLCKARHGLLRAGHQIGPDQTVRLMRQLCIRSVVRLGGEIVGTMESSSSQRIWDRYITEADREIYQRAGFGVQGGGGKSPALLIVDVTVEFVGDTPEPIEQSIERFPNSCGEAGWRAMERIASLQQVCREQRVPILYTTGLDDRNEVSRGSWGRKKDLAIECRVDDYIGVNTIPDVIFPLPGETVIQTTKPSAFFGTPLLSYLIQLGVDTLIVTGVTTSGCVRASVVDAFSYNLRVLVAEDAVFDRGKVSHAINCFDMNAKYADVVPTEAVLEYLGYLHDTGSK